MPENEARIGHGNLLEIALASAPSVFIYIEGVFGGSPPADSDDQVDVTDYQSPRGKREFIPGLSDSGEASFEMNYVPGSATDRFLRSIRGETLIARYTFANGVQLLFNCSRQGYEQDLPNDDKQTATLTLKVSGDPVLTDVTAPRNIELPTIAGVPKVGVPLTAEPGAWAGALDLSFQWQADNVNIAGAIGRSFVPLVGNVGDVISVVVTATNDDFTASAESAGTAAVAA